MCIIRMCFYNSVDSFHKSKSRAGSLSSVRVRVTHFSLTAAYSECNEFDIEDGELGKSDSTTAGLLKEIAVNHTHIIVNDQN